MIEKYFTLQYYLTIAGFIIVALVFLFYFCPILFGEFMDSWKKRQDKKADKYWKEHEDERDKTD